MFKRKTKLEKVLDKRINYVTFRDFLKSLSHKELHILAEDIIWKEYDGYNGSSCYMEQNHFRVELFSLHKINGTDGYCKKIYKENGEYNIEFKCLDNYMMPFVLRYFLGEEITESDKVFYHEGLLAKFIDEPKIEVNLDEKIEN